MKIPFNKPYLSGNEKKYIEKALEKNELSGDGYYTKKVSLLLENKFNLSKVLMTTSGTHALEMAAELINLKEGDEVIMPSFTFTSTANAVLKKNAKPVFAEIKKNTFNLDPQYIEKYINKNTKAIIPVHYAGVGCEMDEIMNIAQKYGLYVIEDAAHAVNAKYKNNYLGGLGDFGCYSFHSSKNYISGEGGALIINNDDNFSNRAEIIRDKGTNRKSFLKGEVDKYTWVDQGSSYLPSDLLMALLYGQLKKLKDIKKSRKNIYKYYKLNLKKYLKTDFIDFISPIPKNRDSNFHIFYIKFANNKIRDYVLEKLQKRGITASFHYIPLHSSPMGKRLGYKKNDLKTTNEVSETLLRLPIYPDLSKKELKYIIENIKDIFNSIIKDRGSNNGR